MPLTCGYPTTSAVIAAARVSSGREIRKADKKKIETTDTAFCASRWKVTEKGPRRGHRQQPRMGLEEEEFQDGVRGRGI